MLDKTIPYIDICMKRNAGTALPSYALPEGYRFTFYTPGSEKDWARIETSVQEFDCEMNALLYFQKEFSPYTRELPLRNMYVETTTGEKVGTATAWWDYTGRRRDPMVHWVAVKPTHQGKGVGKALIRELVRLMLEDIEGDCAFYLHTQTWSHKAVRLYEWVGFHITDEPNLQGRENNRSAEAIALLSRL